MTDLPRTPHGRSMRERMLAGEPYNSDDAEIAAMQLAAMDRVTAYNATSGRDAAKRRQLLEALLDSVGVGTEIRPPLYVDYGCHTRIGARCFVNFGLVALDVAAITIGDDVQIGPYVQLLTPTHPLEPDSRRAGWESAEPIRIENNVWLGGGAIVLPGVTVGCDSVVGAGAVVTRDVPPSTVVVGNPARVVRSLGRG